MPTMSEIESKIEVGFRDLLFSVKVMTAVIGTGFAITAIGNAYQQATQMREVQNLSSQVNTLSTQLQGMSIHQSQNIERSTTREDAIEREMHRLRNQEQKQ